MVDFGRKIFNCRAFATEHYTLKYGQRHRLFLCLSFRIKIHSKPDKCYVTTTCHPTYYRATLINNNNSNTRDKSTRIIPSIRYYFGLSVHTIDWLVIDVRHIRTYKALFKFRCILVLLTIIIPYHLPIFIYNAPIAIYKTK